MHAEFGTGSLTDRLELRVTIDFTTDQRSEMGGELATSINAVAISRIIIS